MSVSTLVLLGLALVWAVVLLPEGIARFSSLRSGDSIRSFSNQLSSIQRQPQAGAARGSNVIDLGDRRPSGTRSVSPAVRKRRQEVLGALGGAALVTLLGAVAFGGLFVLLFLLAGGLFVAYVAALVQVTNRTAARHNPARAAIAGSAGRPATRVEPAVAVGRVMPVQARRIAN
ncbi:MAG: hypothetical protein ACOYOP_09020 [Microthrixaceae bacterium]